MNKPSRKKTGTARRVTEEAEQTALFAWADMMSAQMPELGMLMHVPNEGKRSAAAGGRLKAAGLRRGFPDLILPVPGIVEAVNGVYESNGLYIELKRPGGTVRREQKWWMHNLFECGNLAVVCYGFEEAVEMICCYLDIEPPMMGRQDHRKPKNIVDDSITMLWKWADDNHIRPGNLADARLRG